jgi:drug/metabolite transporter (DMT)-like permease
MIYLLASIFCSTIIFVVFKLFQRFEVSNLPAIVINYAVAGILGFTVSTANIQPIAAIQSPWFPEAVLLGSIFILLFQLMAWVAQKIGVALVSVAVKMSLVIPVLFGIVVYGESTHLIKILGIALALLAVYLASRKSEPGSAGKLYFWLPILLFVGSGFLDVFIKYLQAFTVPTRAHAVFIAAAFLCACTIGLVYWTILFFSKRERLQVQDIIGGFALGIPNFGSIYFLFKALEYQGLESSVVFPLNNVGIVVGSVLFGALVFKEQLNRYNKIGILLALIAIACIAVSI